MNLCELRKHRPTKYPEEGGDEILKTYPSNKTKQIPSNMPALDKRPETTQRYSNNTPKSIFGDQNRAPPAELGHGLAQFGTKGADRSTLADQTPWGGGGTWGR